MCKRNFIAAVVFAVLGFYSLSVAGSQVTIIVTSIPANTPDGSSIYIAGNMNNWNAGHPEYLLTPNAQGHPSITLQGSGTLSFKFTRGSWPTVEGNANGGFLPNRSFTFGTADTLLVSILSWEDTGGNNSTAAENVVVMHTAFAMPQLGRTRRIWLYLPPDYNTSDKHYPVLYMHDGQNLFDQATAFAGEWQVDETLNQLHGQGKQVPIVVGIDNGGANRLAEYTPWPNSQYGGGEGALYAQFIVETLKPYIDEHYRTLPQREYTAVMGSSLGGLISFYIAHKYQDVFSRAGVFSPSFWFSDSVYGFASEMGRNHPMKYYLMGGTQESASLVAQMQAMIDTLSSIGFSAGEMHLKVVPGGQHNEALWRSQFGEAYQWLFDLQSTHTLQPGSKSPNSCRMFLQGSVLHLQGNCRAFQTEGDLQVFNLNGQMVFAGTVAADRPVQIPFPVPGIYVARLSWGTEVLRARLLYF